jgi:signal transduction histidine kinase
MMTDLSTAVEPSRPRTETGAAGRRECIDQRRHTFLIVDDEEDVLDSLRHLFHRQYRVLTAPSGAEALELLRRNEVHLILSDQRMPGMPGDVFLRESRAIAPDAIRMLFTGYADIQAVISAVNEGGIFRYMVKPWDTAELEWVVRQAAEQHDLLAERRRLIAELQDANARLTKANRELEEASALKSAFLEVASHELNTPITIVFGLSELLRLLNPNREQREREIIDRIAGGARQLARLVANLLKLMRADDFRRTLDLAAVDLGALLRTVVDQVAPFIRSRRLRLQVEIADELGSFEIDADKIRDVVTNLLTNAIKFTPDGGSCTLRARLAVADIAEIEVSDQGIGIEPRALGQLFQPFFTEFDPSCHSTGDFGFKKRGMGLGLSIVKKFIELHGGGVSAESTLGQGTRFLVRLPRHPNPSRRAPAESAASSTPTSSNGPR